MATVKLGDEKPPVIVTMSYEEAKAFMEWLGKAEGSGKGVQYEVWDALTRVVERD